jgi:hypothetical protein
LVDVYPDENIKIFSGMPRFLWAVPGGEQGNVSPAIGMQTGKARGNKNYAADIE